MLPLVWLFICVILVMGLAYLFTKHVVGRNLPVSFGGMQQSMLRIVAQMPLGRDRQVILIQAGERYFLLGSTANETNLLAELSAEEVEAWREKERQMGEAGQSPSFAKSLQEILKQRGGRYHGD